MTRFIGVVLFAVVYLSQVVSAYHYRSFKASKLTLDRPLHHICTRHPQPKTSRPIVSSQLLGLREIIDPSYDFAAGSAVIGTIFGGLENFKGKLGKVFGAGAIIFTLFGGFLAFQTTTLRFQFDETNFSLVKADQSKMADNVVVGGENSWKFDSFVNYDFLPSEDFPILVYFKETQTPVENRVDVPIVVDNLEGQGHFFPVIANAKQLAAGFESHHCAKLLK